MDSLPLQPTSNKTIKITSSTLVTQRIAPVIGNQSHGGVGAGGGGSGGTCNNCCKDMCGMLQLCLVQNGSPEVVQQVCVNCGKTFVSQRDLNENPSVLKPSGPRQCLPTSGIPNIPGIGNVDQNLVNPGPSTAQQVPQTCTGKAICKQICLTPSKILRLAENKILGGDKDCQADFYQVKPSCGPRPKVKRCGFPADRKVHGCDCCEKSKRKANFSFGISSCTRKNDCKSKSNRDCRCSCRGERSCGNELEVRGVACCPQLPAVQFAAHEADPCQQFHTGADERGYGQRYGRGIGAKFQGYVQRGTFGPEQNQELPPAGGLSGYFREQQEDSERDESISDAGNFISPGYGFHAPPKNGQGFNNPGSYPTPNNGQRFNNPGNYPAPNNGHVINNAGNYPPPNNGEGFHYAGNYPDSNNGQGFNDGGNYPDLNSGPVINNGGNFTAPYNGQVINNGGNHPVPNNGQGFHNAGNYPDSNNGQGFNDGGNYPSPNNDQVINNGGNYPAPYNGQGINNGGNYPAPYNGQGINNAGYPPPNNGKGINNAGNYPVARGARMGAAGPQGGGAASRWSYSRENPDMETAESFGGSSGSGGQRKGYQPRYSRAQTVRKGNRGNDKPGGRFDNFGDPGSKVKGGRRQDQQMLTDGDSQKFCTTDPDSDDGQLLIYSEHCGNSSRYYNCDADFNRRNVIRIPYATIGQRISTEHAGVLEFWKSNSEKCASPKRSSSQNETSSWKYRKSTARQQWGSPTVSNPATNQQWPTMLLQANTMEDWGTVLNFCIRNAVNAEQYKQKYEIKITLLKQNHQKIRIGKI